MSETLNAQDIAKKLQEQLTSLSATVDTHEVSTVDEVGDGIARVSGLKSAMAGELLEFKSSDTGETVFGLAQNLDLSTFVMSSSSLLMEIWAFFTPTTVNISGPSWRPVRSFGASRMVRSHWKLWKRASLMTPLFLSSGGTRLRKLPAESVSMAATKGEEI